MDTKMRRRLSILQWIYIIAEAAVLVLLKTLELLQRGPALQTGLMYGVIVLNTCVAFLLSPRRISFRRAAEGEQAALRSLFLFLGLFMTLAADTVLVLLNRNYPLGVLFFCFVQTLYGISLRPEMPVVWFRTAGSLLVAAVVFSGISAALYAASAWSILQLSLNVIEAWRVFRADRSENEKRLLLFALGLSLFWCCDISVGIYNLSAAASGMLSSVSGFLMWVFYLPSQALLVLAAWNRPVIRGTDQVNHENTT